MSPPARAEMIGPLNAQIQPRVDEFANAITSELGSSITFSTSVKALAPTMVIGDYADLARTFPFEELRDGVLGKAWILREAVGVVAPMIRWNAPLFVATYKLAPGLAAGCSVVLTPPPDTPLFAYVLADALEAAQVP